MHHCKIASSESALFFSFTNIVAKFKALSNKIEEGLSGLPFDKTKNMINNRARCYSRCSLCCTSAFKHFRTDIFIIMNRKQ